MNLNLNEEQIKEIKMHYTRWEEANERRKQIADEIKDICKSAASVLESTKQSDASKLFKNMQMLNEGQDAEADNISLLLERIKGTVKNG